jgi:hypothetical protein
MIMRTSFEDLVDALFDSAVCFTSYIPKSTNTKTVNSMKNPKAKDDDDRKLSPPWWTVQKKIKAMFKDDPDIEIKSVSKGGDASGVTYVFYLDTPDAAKAIALEKILKTEYNFGNIKLKVTVRVTNANNKTVLPAESIYDNYLDALATTPAVVDIRHVVDMFGTKWIVIDFKKEVVQFWNDDLTDYYGNWNGLYTDIATDIFKYNPAVKYTIAETDD